MWLSGAGERILFPCFWPGGWIWWEGCCWLTGSLSSFSFHQPLFYSGDPQNRGLPREEGASILGPLAAALSLSRRAAWKGPWVAGALCLGTDSL